MRMPDEDEDSGVRAATASRYRALLDVSSAAAEQPTVEALLHSLRDVLSHVSAFHGAGLYLLSDDAKTLQLVAIDRPPDGPLIPPGTEVARGGVIARVLDEQRPIHLPDLSQEMLKFPQLAPYASGMGARSGYLFPVSTFRKQYGLVVFGRMDSGEFSPEELELMNSVATHIAVALESALATDRAEHYQRELAKERDCLRLLLEINNAVVSHLDVDEVFRSASALIRDYFGSELTAVWLIDRQSDQIQRVLLDFPSGKGFLDQPISKQLTQEEHDKLRRRQADLISAAEIEKLPSPIAEELKAESINLMAIAPLVTASGPIGVVTMGSRRPDAFGQQQLELFSQIAMQISLAVDNALAYGRLNASNAQLEEQRVYLESEIRSEYSFEDIVGKSAALRKVLDQVAIVAPTGSTVLLLGETGTGKELIARAIHNLSPRRDRTFVRLNCAAIPSGLVESELFGHEKGAFTGALMQKNGRFELADHGTLFLDEIGDISMELQPKLLRALQEREFERLGSTKTIHVDVRLIAATHRDLANMILNNQFREDLFYRLNVFPIEIPPLRERREDIPLLIHYFVARLSRRMQKRIKSIPKQSMEMLVKADWPGNVRELENFIERCVILTQGDELHVPRAELTRSSSRPPAVSPAGASTFEEAERQVIIDALKAASGKIAGMNGAAERLGLKRTTLQNKMRRLNIGRADYMH
jgi:formate hydrogenlyase transcriptional activator